MPSLALREIGRHLNRGLAFRPDHHIAIPKCDGQEVAIVPRQRAIQGVERERQHAHLIVCQHLPVMRRGSHVGRALRPGYWYPQQQKQEAELHERIVFPNQKVEQANRQT